MPDCADDLASGPSERSEPSRVPQTRTNRRSNAHELTGLTEMGPARTRLADGLVVTAEVTDAARNGPNADDTLGFDTVLRFHDGSIEMVRLMPWEVAPCIVETCDWIRVQIHRSSRAGTSRLELDLLGVVAEPDSYCHVVGTLVRYVGRTVVTVRTATGEFDGAGLNMSAAGLIPVGTPVVMSGLPFRERNRFLRFAQLRRADQVPEVAGLDEVTLMAVAALAADGWVGAVAGLVDLAEEVGGGRPGQ